MKILFCVNSLVKGGAERVICNLSNYLIKNHEISIVTMINYDIGYELDNRIKTIMLDNKRKDFNSKDNKFIKLKKLITRKQKLKKVLNDVDPDIIITFLPESSFMVLSTKRKKDKIIVSVRNDPKIEYASRVYNYLMKKLYPKADGFVFQTKEAKEYFDDILVSPSKIIPNPINKDFIIKPFSGKREKEIVSVGRLTKQKNFELLIDSFYELQNEFSGYKLIIYGEGELRSELENKIKNYNLQNKVLLPGVVNSIQNKIYKSSLFVLPSIYEGMPNALMEAMALGLPVVSSDCPCGGPRELIEDNVSGLLFEVNNKEDLQNKIRMVLSDEKNIVKLSKNASQISISHNPEVINKKWEEFIFSIFKGSD